MSRVLFVPCSVDGLERAGSIHVRCEWVADNWDGAEVWDATQRLSPDRWDLVVFQKAYLLHGTRRMIERVVEWRDAGKCRLALDYCDPDHLEREHRRRLMKVLGLFDFCVGSTQRLARWLARWNVAYHVPDCVDVAAIREIGEWQSSGLGAPYLVWAGYEKNVGALQPMLGTIGRLGWPLEVMSIGRSIPFEEYWRRVLRNPATGKCHDVLLNPRPAVGKFAWKSDNKTQAAWALGMPVARTPDELESFADPEARKPGEPRDVSVAVGKWKEIARQWL